MPQSSFERALASARTSRQVREAVGSAFSSAAGVEGSIYRKYKQYLTSLKQTTGTMGPHQWARTYGPRLGPGGYEKYIEYAKKQQGAFFNIRTKTAVVGLASRRASLARQIWNPAGTAPGSVAHEFAEGVSYAEKATWRVGPSKRPHLGHMSRQPILAEYRAQAAMGYLRGGEEGARKALHSAIKRRRDLTKIGIAGEKRRAAKSALYTHNIPALEKAAEELDVMDRRILRAMSRPRSNRAINPIQGLSTKSEKLYRLYRGQTAMPLSEAMQIHPKSFRGFGSDPAAESVKGRWYTSDIENARYYRDRYVQLYKDIGIKDPGQIMYVDVPENVYKAAAMGAQPPEVRALSKAREHHREFVLPGEWAGKARPLGGGAINPIQGLSSSASVAHNARAEAAAVRLSHTRAANLTDPLDEMVREARLKGMSPDISLETGLGGEGIWKPYASTPPPRPKPAASVDPIERLRRLQASKAINPIPGLSEKSKAVHNAGRYYIYKFSGRPLEDVLSRVEGLEEIFGKGFIYERDVGGAGKSRATIMSEARERLRKSKEVVVDLKYGLGRMASQEVEYAKKLGIPITYVDDPGRPISNQPLNPIQGLKSSAAARHDIARDPFDPRLVYSKETLSRAARYGRETFHTFALDKKTIRQMAKGFPSQYEGLDVPSVSALRKAEDLSTLSREFSWSVSRARLFDSSKKDYWFKYYGSWGGWNRGAHESVRKAYLRGKTDTLGTWIGTTVHKAIKEDITLMSQNRLNVKGRTGVIDFEDRISKIVQQMSREFGESQRGEWVHNPKNTLRLLQHEMGKEISTRELRKAQAEATSAYRAAVSTFSQKIETFAPDIGPGGIREFLAIDPEISEMSEDQILRMNVHGKRIKVHASPDLAFVYQNKAGLRKTMLIDWKTGALDQQALMKYKEQLKVYALYANKMWGTDPRDMELAIAHLDKGKVKPYRFAVTQKELRETENMIVSSAGRMVRSLVGTDAEKNIMLSKTAGLKYVAEEVKEAAQTPPKPGTIPQEVKERLRKVMEDLEVGKASKSIWGAIPRGYKVGGGLAAGALVAWWLFSGNKSRRGDPRSRGYGWQPADPRMNQAVPTSRSLLNYNYSMSGMA